MSDASLTHLRSFKMFGSTLLLLTAAVSAATPSLPTSSICSSICPGCNTTSCECGGGCWPGQSFTATPDHTCDCFATLDFCKTGEKPTWLPGATCPSCWPAENTACMCVASVGFCEAPAVLPTKSRCDTICPGCDSPTCTCPEKACWPGTGWYNTSDHNCASAQLSCAHSPSCACPRARACIASAVACC